MRQWHACGKARLTLVLAALMAAAVPAGAATLTFTDQATFMAQVQPGYYIEDFAGLASGSLGVSSLGFSGSGFAYTASVSTMNLWGTNVGSLALSTESSSLTNILLLSFTSGNVYAVGGNFFYDNDAGGAAGVDVLLTLNDGTNLSLALANTLTFGGFVSDTPITSLSFAGGGDGLWPAMDNVVVGASAIPEPASFLLFLGGAAGILILRRRR